MVYGDALKSCHRLSNRRGAAFLLAVYFASLMFLLLGGVSLQRTMTEVKAASLSRDLHQAFWSADGAFDRSLRVLSSNMLPPTQADLAASKQGGFYSLLALGQPLTFDDLGCIYRKEEALATNGGAASYYMICKATNPDGTINPEQFQVETLGLSPNQAPVWISSMVLRATPTVTLGQAIVGVDGITVNRAEIGGVNTRDPAHPVSLAGGPPLLVSGLPNVFGLSDGWGNLTPSVFLDGFYNNQGHLATKSTAPKAIQLLGGSVVYGGILGGPPPAQPGGVFDAASIGNATAILDLPAVRMPATSAMSLANTLLPSTRTVDAAGNITISNHWAAVSSGRYYAKSLTLSDASFSTNGPVELFIDGSLTVTRSLLYGQPETLAAGLNTLQFAPANLIIYVAANGQPDQQVLIERGSVAGGVIYAPAVPVQVTRKSLVLGALVGKTVQVGLSAAVDPWSLLEGTTPGTTRGATRVYFDQSVAGTKLSPQPESLSTKVLFYRVRKSLSEASAATGQNAQRLVRWFQFTGFNPTPPPPGQPASGGTGWGGGCGY